MQLKSKYVHLYIYYLIHYLFIKKHKNIIHIHNFLLVTTILIINNNEEKILSYLFS